MRKRIMAEVLKDIQVSIEPQDVLRLTGYRGRETGLDDRMRETLEAAIAEGRSLIEPKALCTWFEVEEMGQTSLVLEGDFSLNVGSGARSWKGAQFLAIALCSIGEMLEKRVSQEFEQGDFPQALMLDCVGSVAADSVADYVNYLVCQRAKALGIGVGRRTSPGYGKWDIREQKVLFTLLSGESIGVRLNESCMMIPRKSVSFAAGVGKGILSERGFRPCRYCNMVDCQYRILSHRKGG